LYLSATEDFYFVTEIPDKLECLSMINFAEKSNICKELVLKVAHQPSLQILQHEKNLPDTNTLAYFTAS
jgi:hypothetical protein